MTTTDNTKALENALDAVNRLVRHVAILEACIDDGANIDDELYEQAALSTMSLPGYIIEMLQSARKEMYADDEE